jgi:VanZ family protein
VNHWLSATLHRTTRRPQLAGFILAYCVFIVLGSLYPFSGWVELNHDVLSFLYAPWPKYITRTDLATNLLSYMPLGYAFAIWFSTPGHRLRGVAFGVVTGMLLSLLCEALQQMLATRIASNLDLLVNTLGTLFGALLAIHHRRWLRAGTAIHRWRLRWFKQGAWINVGLVLIGLWLLAQFALVPASGLGWIKLHLRPLDIPPESLSSLNVEWFVAMFLETFAIGAFTACLLKPGRYVGGIVLVVLVSFFSKLIVATVLLKLAVVGGVLSLETMAALVLAFWLLLLPTISRRRFEAALISLVFIMLVRYSATDHFWPVASFLNIVGLAKLAGTLWPLASLAHLFIARIGQRTFRR